MSFDPRPCRSVIVVSVRPGIRTTSVSEWTPGPQSDSLTLAVRMPAESEQS
jgi:hypothetical protein